MGAELLLGDLGNVIIWVVLTGVALWTLQYIVAIGSSLIVVVVGLSIWIWEGVRKGNPGVVGLLLVSVAIGAWFLGRKGSEEVPGDQPATTRLEIARTGWLADAPVPQSQRDRLEPLYVEYLMSMAAESYTDSTHHERQRAATERASRVPWGSSVAPGSSRSALTSPVPLYSAFISDSSASNSAMTSANGGGSSKNIRRMFS